MANEYKCSYCGGDGSRCRCIQEHGGGRTFEDDETIQKRQIEKNERELLALLDKQ